MRILAVCVPLYIVFLNVQTEFLGGTISWREYEGTTRFVYRMTWQRETGPCGPGCYSGNVTSKGNLNSKLAALSWKCTSGCTGNTSLAGINYYVTSVSFNSSAWEQGEDQFFHNFTGTGPFIITLDGLSWAGTSGLGRLVTSVDLRIRNDTNVSNASPIAAVPPTVGIPFGCRSVISLPIEDPDADTYRCRLATPTECGQACTNFPHVLVNEENCTVTINTVVSNGFSPDTDYRLTVMIEDFPDYTVTVGHEVKNPRHSLSKIPLQFTVRVLGIGVGCSDLGMTFTSPDIPDGVLFPYPGLISGVFKFSYYIETTDIDSTEFLVSVAAGLNYTTLPDDKGRIYNVTHLYGEWSPRRDQSGDSLNCVWGIKDNGLTTTEKRCTVGYINDYNHCNSSIQQCKRNGTCITLYKRYTCKCPHGFKPPDCEQRVSCLDFPCKHNGSCVDTGTMYKCSCAPGYTGVDCEWRYDNCQSRPCLNAGICQTDTNGFQCRCQSNYTGDLCQTRIQNTLGKVDTNPPAWPIIVGVLGGVAAAAAVSACCWWYYFGAGKRRQREKEKKVAPTKQWTDEADIKDGNWNSDVNETGSSTNVLSNSA